MVFVWLYNLDSMTISHRTTSHRTISHHDNFPPRQFPTTTIYHYDNFPLWQFSTTTISHHEIFPLRLFPTTILSHRTISHTTFSHLIHRLCMILTGHGRDKPDLDWSGRIIRGHFCSLTSGPERWIEFQRNYRDQYGLNSFWKISVCECVFDILSR